jgi:hypothetical protein
MQSVAADAGAFEATPRSKNRDEIAAKTLVLTKGGTPYIRERTNGIGNIPMWIHSAGYQQVTREKPRSRLGETGSFSFNLLLALN